MEQQTQTDIQRLPEIVTDLKGVGIPGLKVRLVKRTDKKAWYLRDDGVHEVFKIKVRREEISQQGKQYPKREIYPNNEDFGRIAWNYIDEMKARNKYEEI